MPDERIVPIHPPRRPTQVDDALLIECLTAATNAQNLPARLHQAGGLTRDEVAAIEATADAFVAQVRRHFSAPFNAFWPDAPAWRD